MAPPQAFGPSQEPNQPSRQQPQVRQFELQSLDNQAATQLLEKGKTLFQCYVASHRKRDLYQAVESFQKALALDTQNPALYLYLANSMWEQGSISIELAKFYCQTAIELNSKNWEAYFSLGIFQFQDGLVSDAVDTLEKAIQSNYWQSGRASNYLGQILLQQAAQTKTLSRKLRLFWMGANHMAQGIIRLPLDGQMVYSLFGALILDVKILTVLSLANTSKALGLKGLKNTILKWGSHLTPQEGLFDELLGDDALYEHGQPLKALQHYERSLERNPDNTAILQRICKAQADLNNLEGAKESLEQSLEVNENDVMSHFNLAQIHIEEKAFMKSLFHLKEAERLCPSDPYIHSNMAYVMFKLEDVEGALYKYKQALALGENPEWMTTVAQTIGTIYHQVYTDKTRAMEYFQKALDYKPNNVEAWTSSAQLNYETGKLEDALICYRHLLEYMPNNPECYCNIGYILWQLDRNDQAIDAYQIALRMAPDNAIAKNNLGVIYLDDKNNAEEALRLFEEAFAKNPQYTLACFNIGRAYEQLGQTQAAAKAFQQAKALNATHPELSDDEIDAHLKRLFY